MALFGRRDDIHDGGDADSRRRLGLAVLALVAVLVASIVVDVAFKGPGQGSATQPAETSSADAQGGVERGAEAGQPVSDGAGDEGATPATYGSGDADEVILSGIAFSGASHLSALDSETQTDLGRAVRVWLDARGKGDAKSVELTRDAKSSTTGATAWLTADGTDAMVSLSDSWAVEDDEGTVTVSMTDQKLVQDPTPVSASDAAGLEAVVGADAASALGPALSAWASESGVDVAGATVSPSSAAPGADGTSIDFRVDLPSGGPVMATYDTTAQQFSFTLAQ